MLTRFCFSLSNSNQNTCPSMKIDTSSSVTRMYQFSSSFWRPSLRAYPHTGWAHVRNKGPIGVLFPPPPKWLKKEKGNLSLENQLSLRNGLFSLNYRKTFCKCFPPNLHSFPKRSVPQLKLIAREEMDSQNGVVQMKVATLICWWFNMPHGLSGGWRGLTVDSCPKLPSAKVNIIFLFLLKRSWYSFLSDQMPEWSVSCADNSTAK